MKGKKISGDVFSLDMIFYKISKVEMKQEKLV